MAEDLLFGNKRPDDSLFWIAGMGEGKQETTKVGDGRSPAPYNVGSMK
jgi:hypothetical protein